jgi:hypothetical protein
MISSELLAILGYPKRTLPYIAVTRFLQGGARPLETCVAGKAGLRGFPLVFARRVWELPVNKRKSLAFLACGRCLQP